MANLILKDILIQKKSFITGIICSLPILLNFRNLGASIYTFLPILITFVFITNAILYDEKAEILLNSLPIKRIHIVSAKYISIFLFTLIGIITMFLLVNIIKFLGTTNLPISMNIENIFISFVLSLILNCINFPLYFKYGYLKARFIPLILIFGVFFLLSSLDGILHKYINYEFIVINLNNMPQIILNSIIILICFIVFIISFSLSCNIYKNKDL
ncbi:ABC-2 transporter permease [Clostridium tyrobutyricum]|uniref:ABC-2 transporter permease n=1 Tax=Clostridium tyrobutyricum TaxID=1519 RepID=UPI00031EF685|nr:ABC-2 transporter permease [Clostridium tyrobutyricum]MBV4431168.1 ABC-2 transporter permease [Clostridium tyrobutyricum]MEA5007445.1 ABC-2 transporter permease [Clostridium tyrobutyricum]